MDYLGTPFGGNMKSTAFWSPILENMEKKLDSWKFAYIFKGGRLTLIQAVLSSLPTYYLSVSKLPPRSIRTLKRYCIIFCGKVPTIVVARILLDEKLLLYSKNMVVLALTELKSPMKPSYVTGYGDT